MGYLMKIDEINSILAQWNEECIVYAPVNFEGGGTFANTDCVRYGQISKIEDIVFDRKSRYSFKEVLLPITQTLFFFTEEVMKEADSSKKGAIVFLRSCDLHAVARLDQIYLKNGAEDYYYKRLREKIKFVLMGCSSTFENCFCADMGTNKSDNYDCSVDLKDGMLYVNNKNPEWDELFSSNCSKQMDVSPACITEKQELINIPDNITTDVINSKIWDEYDTRCINCGRCNFVCPTCTCFTMQDIFYTDNGKVGERRRVWASCMVDGFTDMAGGIKYRSKNGQRMRFRVLHKVYDYKKRNGEHMCVGCGRCDNVCPEYISFIGCVNKLQDAIEEVSADASK